MSTGSRPMTWNGAGALVESKRELRDEVFVVEGDEYNLTGSSVANLSIARLLCNRSHEGKRGGRLTSEVTASVAVHYARGDPDLRSPQPRSFLDHSNFKFRKYPRIHIPLTRNIYSTKPKSNYKYIHRNEWVYKVQVASKRLNAGRYCSQIEEK